MTKRPRSTGGGTEPPEGPGRKEQREVELHAHEGELSLSEAKRLADAAARDRVPDPMLLAWFSRKTGEHSPKVECCGEDKPAWLVYAESRGGNLTIRLNDGEYVFVYRVEGDPDPSL